MKQLSAEKNKKWKLIELLNKTADYLSEKEFDDARLNAELLLGHALGLSRVDLYTNYDRPLIAEELDLCRALLKRRMAHEPLQYILGETEFYSLPFKVTRDVLIPRPETELLVEKVIEQCSAHDADQDDIQIVDVGTGSGNIAIAIAKNIENATVTAVDVSRDALMIAYGNAQAHEVNVKFKELDALKPWPAEYSKTFDIVVSNPPYIGFSEYENLPPEIKKYEPKSSLLSGNDGLDFYRKFANILPTLLKQNGTAFFEIGERQASSVKNIYADCGFADIRVYDDMAGKNRVVKMQWNRNG
ncbi:peptide chain release factor N(5)-glutamine methyltransferase [candidate division KSB1 bacterium]|nr:peptide chain release factor N(5)-glutamine methyltransferase [candidate division KSB1 bacterium]RQW05283.1 MAG: peptide chain release factor N(5)-glutamine methyltransferase [candidate division KSB1 bacterium]